MPRIFINSITYLQIGAEVLKKDFRRQKRKGGKLDHRWLGPYTIAQDLGKGFYSLSDGEDIIVKRICGAHLKIYVPPQPSEERSLANPSFEEVRFIFLCYFMTH